MRFVYIIFIFFFSSRRRHTRSLCDWSSDVCSSDLAGPNQEPAQFGRQLVEDVAGQVFPGQPRAAAQCGEDSTPFQRRLAAGGEVEQLQSGRPTLGAARQLSELFGRQRFTIEITE